MQDRIASGTGGATVHSGTGGVAGGHPASIGNSATAGGSYDNPSSLNMVGGNRTVRKYEITDAELENLGPQALFSAIFFSFASSLISFFLSIWLSMEFASGIDETTKSTWTFIFTVVGIAALFAICAGIFFHFLGSNKIKKFKAQTKFPP
jgi:hypothetical protein